MFDFENVLMEDEVILYQGNAVPGKGSKSIFGELFLLGFSLFIAAILWASLKFGIGDGEGGINLSFIVIMAVDLLFVVIALYSIFYKKFKQDRDVADDAYCITNKRVLRFNGAQLLCGYLANFDTIEEEVGKDGYGNVTFYRECPDSATDEEQMAFLKAMKNQDDSDRMTMQFECVQDPKSIAKIAKKARAVVRDQIEEIVEETEEDV